MTTTNRNPGTPATELSAKTAAGREIVIERIINAPRELVFKAWTDPEQVATWWGPEHFTAPVCKIDLRVGGKYLYCMRSPEGQDFWSTGVFKEIVVPERIVCTDSFADAEGNIVPGSDYGMQGDWPLELVVTVMFEELGDKTKLTLRHSGIPAGEMLEMTEAGWNGSLDKFVETVMTAKG